MRDVRADVPRAEIALRVSSSAGDLSSGSRILAPCPLL